MPSALVAGGTFSERLCPERSYPSGRIVAMPVRISCLCIDAVDPRPVADFWAAVLGWDVIEDGVEGISLAAPDRDLPTVDILPVPEAKRVKNRLHLDLRADGCSFDSELERLEGLGARRVDVGQGPDVTWVVFADPEGNEFCLLRRTVQEVLAETP
jgi:predicted enzyme related to lactoylglutathione lyase